MGGIVGSDGLTDEDREEEYWSQSDKMCEGCEEMISYGDEVVVLRLVYPAPYYGNAVLLDALDENDGGYTADPVLLCFYCWDAYSEDLRTHLNDLFITRKTAAQPSPLRCAFCQKNINWGDYCGHAMYGELDLSPRTKETTFTLSKYENDSNAELVCLDCIEWINEECDENIWPELWMNNNGQEESEAGV